MSDDIKRQVELYALAFGGGGAVKPQEKQVYSHRNGETEPPKVAGYFWFLETDHNFLVYRVEPIDRTTFRLDGDTYDSRVWAGRWWGPVTPPWEVTEQEATQMDVAQKGHIYQVEFEQASLLSSPHPEKVMADGWRIIDGALIFYGDESEIVYNWSKVLVFQRVHDFELSEAEEPLNFMEEL